MRVDFKRIPHKWTFTFEASIGKSIWSAQVKRLFIPYPRKVYVKENGNDSFRLEETTLLKRYLLKLLFLPFTSFLVKKKSRYSIIENEQEVGSIECFISGSEHKYDIEYKNTKYTVYHMIYKNRIRYYFFKNHYQVGVVEKSKVGTKGVNPYYGKVNDDIPQTVVLALLLLVHARKLHDIALSYEAYSKSYTVYGGQIQNKNLDVEFNHINLTEKMSE